MHDCGGRGRLGLESRHGIKSDRGERRLRVADPEEIRNPVSLVIAARARNDLNSRRQGLAVAGEQDDSATGLQLLLDLRVKRGGNQHGQRLRPGRRKVVAGPHFIDQPPQLARRVIEGNRRRQFGLLGRIDIELKEFSARVLPSETISTFSTFLAGAGADGAANSILPTGATEAAGRLRQRQRSCQRRPLDFPGDAAAAQASWL